MCVGGGGGGGVHPLTPARNVPTLYPGYEVGNTKPSTINVEQINLPHLPFVTLYSIFTLLEQKRNILLLLGYVQVC